MGCQDVCSEAGLCAESRGLPVLEDVVGGGRRSGQLRGEDPYQRIRSFGEIRGARDDHGRPDLGLQGTDQDTDHYIARPQSRSSDSSASRRRRDPALNSFRSSSDQESDQSILWFGASSARRSASADSSVAVSGGKRRKASTNEASRSFSCISIPCTQYTANRSVGFLGLYLEVDAHVWNTTARAAALSAFCDSAGFLECLLRSRIRRLGAAHVGGGSPQPISRRKPQKTPAPRALR
jgi:hypothetical protein